MKRFQLLTAKSDEHLRRNDRSRSQTKNAASTPVARLAAAGNRAISRRIAEDEALPRDLRSRMEGLSGYALGDVRVHRGSSEPARMDALAFTQGSTIHLGSGQDEHLAHEAWHVVQQKQGRVPTTGEVDGRPLNHTTALEAEADAMGERAMASETKGTGSLQNVSAPSTSPVQLKCGNCGAGSHSTKKCPKLAKPAAAETSSGGRGLTKAGKKEKGLFELILPKLDHESMYGKGAKSLVGGYNGKSNGLKDNSVRIDRQGLGNVQFQIGDDSYACAEFEQDDEPAAIIAALRKSLESGENETAE
ncbi:MAG: DUF4157 domain-containing protein [bacterium]